MLNNGWIGVDLDGTLAEYMGWKGIEHIGRVIEPMKQRILQWIEEDIEVKIFTARVQEPDAIPYIQDWLKENGLPDLEITNVKDFGMIQLWDDRCVQVVLNEGIPGPVKQIQFIVDIPEAERTTNRLEYLLKLTTDAYSPVRTK